jgi:hypothetical protein
MGQRFPADGKRISSGIRGGGSVHAPPNPRPPSRGQVKAGYECMYIPDPDQLLIWRL